MLRSTKTRYVADSPYVQAAFALLNQSAAKFENFGTIEDKIKRIQFKPEWKQRAHNLHERGQVEKAYLHKNCGKGIDGSPEHDFIVIFKPVITTFKGRPAKVVPEMKIRITSFEKLRDLAHQLRKDRTIATAARDPGTPPLTMADRKDTI